MILYPEKNSKKKMNGNFGITKVNIQVDPYEQERTKDRYSPGKAVD